MTEREIPQLVRDLIYAQEHHLVDDEPARAAVQALQHGVVDDLVRGLIQAPVRKHKIAQAFAGPFALPGPTRGEIVLGFDRRGRPVCVPRQTLNPHSLTIAASGWGKTTKARHVLAEVALKAKGCWWWAFEFDKPEYGVLKPHLAQFGVNVEIVTARQICLNPLQVPESVAPSDWAARVSDMLTQTLELPARATKLFHTTILKRYRQHGVVDGSQQYPTLREVREDIAGNREAHPQAKAACIDALDPLLLSIGDVLGYEVGWPTSALAKRYIVFRLIGIAEVDQNLILNTLILSEFTSRIAKGISNPTMDLFISCDEATRLLHSSDQAGPIARSIRLVRGIGVGLDLSNQSADVDQAILGNTANKFVSGCGSPKDRDIMAAAMELTRDQRRELIVLRPGQFAVRLGDNATPPFIITIPMTQVPKVRTAHMTEGDSELSKELAAIPTVIADERTVRESIRASPTADSAGWRSGEPEVSDAELRYVHAVVNNPGVPSSSLPRLARISPKRAQNIRRRLVELGYLREHGVSTGKRGRTAIVLEPLEPALSLVPDATREAT